MVWAKNGTPDTLTTSGDILSISDLTANIFNEFMSHVIQDGAVDTALRLAGVSATDYASRFSSAGGSDSTETNHTDIRMENTSGKDIFQVIRAVNIDSEEKLVIIHTVDAGNSGVTNAPDRTEIVGKMDTTTTSGQFTQVDVINTDSGDMAADSNLSALGSEGTEELNVQDGAIYYDTDLNKEYVLYNNTWTEI